MAFEQFTELRTITAADLLKNPPLDRAMLLDPWLKERDAVMLFAPTGAGKSQVAMSMALAVAGGREVFGWQASRPFPVLYVDGEMDRGDLAERMEMLRSTVTPSMEHGDLESFHFLARDVHTPAVDFPDLGDSEQGHKLVLDFVEKIKPGLVVLDNLATLATISDENSAADIKKPMELVQKLRQMGCATLLVHHSDKAGKNYRGSSNIATTFAWIIGLQPSASAQPGHMDVTMEWHKTRGRANAATIPKRLRLVNDEHVPRWDVSEPDGLQAARLAKAIKSLGHANLIEAGASIGLKKSQAYEVAKQMYSDGLMTKEDQDRHFKQARRHAEEAANVEATTDF
jgi:KaiC/GvpD/RAD55 family RecA-like ATPase